MSFQKTKRDAIMLDLEADQLHTGLFPAQESSQIHSALQSRFPMQFLDCWSTDRNSVLYMEFSPSYEAYSV